MGSAKQQLVSLKLGEPVGPWIARRQDDGESLLTIAAAIVKATGVSVSPETVRRWVADPQ